MQSDSSFPSRWHADRDPGADFWRDPAIANAGVALRFTDRGVLLLPRTPVGCGRPPARSRPMPRLLSGTLERAAGLCRAFHRRHGRPLVQLLYLDLDNDLYEPHVPPQFTAPDGARWNGSFGTFPAPGPDLRLAGSVQTVAACGGTAGDPVTALGNDGPYLTAAGAGDLTTQLPPFDGLHVLVDPRAAWVDVACFLCVGGDHARVAADDVVTDDQDVLIDAFADRVWRADRLR